MMDIFADAEVEDNPIATLSRDLSDVSVRSLLEQVRQVAEDVRRGF